MTCARYTESDLGRIKTVTSATRPTGASRYVGQRIYESDTGRELMYDGTGWVIMSEPVVAWNTSASWSGITGGSPTYVGDYHRSDGWCDFRCSASFTAAPASITTLVLVLPMAAAYVAAGQFGVQYYDNATGYYDGYNTAATGTAAVGLGVWNSAGTYVVNAGVSATAPFTFGNGDAIEVSGRFRMNSRYA